MGVGNLGTIVLVGRRRRAGRSPGLGDNLRSPPAPLSALGRCRRAGEEGKSPDREIALDTSPRGGQVRRRGTRSRLPTCPPPPFIFLLDNVPFRVVSRLRRRWLRRLLLRMLRKTGALETLEVWGMEKEVGLWEVVAS